MPVAPMIPEGNGASGAPPTGAPVAPGQGLTLETHMLMTGAWHLYRVGERWRKAAHLARAEVEVVGCCSGQWIQSSVVDSDGNSL